MNSKKTFAGKARALIRGPYSMALGGLIALMILGGCGGSEPTPAPPTAAPTNTTAPATPTAGPTASPVPTSANAEVAPAQPASPLNDSPLPTPANSPQGTSGPTGGLGQAAFVREGILYLQSGAGGDLVALDDCSAGKCIINHLDWSADGTNLLYYLGSYDQSVPNQIKVASSAGVTQTLTDQASYVQPAAWSPDGTQVAYRTDTDRYGEAGNGPGQRIQEVWTVTIGEDGALGEPQLHGEVNFGEGCGGGGRSESANVYEREGGFAYGYLSGIMDWTPNGILLYSDNCSTRGVSRFDLTSNTLLDPFPANLRSLSLNSAGDGWVAINGDNQVVMGSPDVTDTTVVSTSAAAEMVFYGQESGTIYYTTLVVSDSVDLNEQTAGTLDPAISIYPYFDKTVDGLFALDPTTDQEMQLYGSDGYALARVRELSDGSILFSRVEDNRELQAAVENGELTAENWRGYLPTVDVLRLALGGTPEVVVTNAEQYTPAKSN